MRIWTHNIAHCHGHIRRTYFHLSRFLPLTRVVSISVHLVHCSIGMLLYYFNRPDVFDSFSFSISIVFNCSVLRRVNVRSTISFDDINNEIIHLSVYFVCVVHFFFFLIEMSNEWWRVVFSHYRWYSLRAPNGTISFELHAIWIVFMFFTEIVTNEKWIMVASYNDALFCGNTRKTLTDLSCISVLYLYILCGNNKTHTFSH